MIWKIFSSPKRGIDVPLPSRFALDTMYAFIGSVLDEQRESMAHVINFDFERATFIEPIGVVVLSNLIEYLRTVGIEVRFKHHNNQTPCTIYLDDSGFFAHYRKKPVFRHSQLRSTTEPLKIIDSARFTEYLYHQLTPWIAQAVGLPEQSMATVRSSLEEILHKVNDHSGVSKGCAFAQHFPNRRQIKIAISDFGRGIPEKVRTLRPEVNDPDALRIACEEGFTTKSNVRNRGAGHPNLTRYVTQRNDGKVIISSLGASLSADKGANNSTTLTSRFARGSYPGTLVQVILQTDTLQHLEADAELEQFEW